MAELSNWELMEIVNFYAGGCLCGHFERCSVCSRSSAEREFETRAKMAAMELLALRSVEIEKTDSLRVPYRVKK